MVVCERQNELFIPVFWQHSQQQRPSKESAQKPKCSVSSSHFPRQKKSCATFVPFVCATGRADFSLDIVFIADDRTHMIYRNDPDYLKQLKRGQITWKWLDQTVLRSSPCYRSLTLATNQLVVFINEKSNRGLKTSLSKFIFDANVSHLTRVLNQCSQRLFGECMLVIRC